MLKPICEKKDYKRADEINNQLVYKLKNKYPKMFKEVLEQKYCDIDGTFLGFMDTYYYLSKIVPKDWIIIDFGCAYNAQSYYFRKHKKFIGIDLKHEIKKRFYFKNTKIFEGKISDYLKLNPPTEKNFAICNNVPSKEIELVRKYYPNCFVYYTA
ncbi:MAG: hypothetical protein PHP92_03395 [Candidatus Nanoarchaeia archaeon]|nr:hypothetical protein [Candidatus Nanoarchaeia archaeon]